MYNTYMNHIINNFSKIKCYYCFNFINTWSDIYMYNDKSFCCKIHRLVYMNSEKIKY